ncbi:MAG: SDR family NAD(P)-dependent oxidoreductase [Vicinamibacterales bacterium]
MVTPPVSSLLDLAGRVALVTGAGSGIGSGIAERLAEAGAAVAVHYHTSAEGARQVCAGITAGGGVASAYQANLTIAAEIASLLDDIARTHGVPDILVNNAGIYPVSSIAAMSEAEWRTVIDATLTSVHLVTRAVAGRLAVAGTPGAIVNIASIEASNVAPMHSHYQAAKAGVIAYTRAAAREFGPARIRVNAISPGLIWREGLDQAWPDGVIRYQQAVPLGRLGRADDVADACLFLVSSASRWVTGAELLVDGGVLTNCAY